MRYSYLIVDDEIVIRQGIKARLGYLEIETKHIFEATNGREALKMVKEHSPEIVITDIRMPDMDGLEFVKKSRETGVLAKFIILSGYAEFAYAEAAIQMGVSDYLLKPISNEALQSALNKVFRMLAGEKEHKEQLVTVRKAERKNKEMTLGNQINNILHSPKTSYGTILVKEDNLVLLGVLNIDKDTYSNHYFNYADIELIKFTIKNIVEELSLSCEKYLVNNIVNRNQMLIVFTGMKNDGYLYQINGFMSKVLHTLYRQMKVYVTVGFSDMKSALSPQAYLEAQKSLSQRLIVGTGHCYFYRDIETLPTEDFLNAELDMLKQYMECRDIVNIEVMLRKILLDKRESKGSVSYIYVVWVRVISSLLKVCDIKMVNQLEQLDHSVLDFQVINRFSSIEELIIYLLTLIIDCMHLDNIVDMNCKSKIILAKKYIEANYNQDIAINDLAYQFAMSPNYFSATFKKETKGTIVNYIKEFRIKKACELLKQTDHSVAQISQMVGYMDSQYFFRVFKKVTGKTPLQYRRSAEESKHASL